ncbi:MAG: phosphoglycerate kinase [Minisyncoccota bacterium]
MIRSIKEAGDLKGKRVLVRVDWNVPVEGNAVLDDFRIKQSLPTIEFLKNAGAEVTLMTHLEPEDRSVVPLRDYLPKGVEIIENLRKNAGEKSNSEEFAKELSQGFDIYVNEAFSVSHREHASIVSVPKFLPGFVGLKFAEEVLELSKVFSPEHPFVFILGGAKFETKLPLVEKFLNIADKIFIGGAMAKHAAEMSVSKNPKVTLPLGDIAALDANEKNIELLGSLLENAKFVVWNGPLGAYERGYTQGTLSLAKLIADSGATSVIGGADTLAAIKELNIGDKFSFISTGGGAMLDFLANETLPGILALDNGTFK